MKRIRSNLKKVLMIVVVFSILLVAAGCGGSNDVGENGGKNFKIGSQGYAEVEILAEIFKQLVESKTNHSVEHVKNFGTSIASFEAIQKNDIQMFTGFTGTILLGTLKQEMKDELNDADSMYKYVRDVLNEGYDLYVAPPYGYNNIYTIAVSRQWAEEHQITKQSQLEPYAGDMILGVDQSWLTLPGMGYDAYTELYGFSFKETPAMDIALLYNAIDSGEVDAVNVYSTDGQLALMDLVTLEDDKQFNPPYNGVLVLRNDTVEENSDIKEIADNLEGMIDTELMQELNARVVKNKIEPSVVAKEFLEEKGLIK